VLAFTIWTAPIHKTGQRLKQWLRGGYFAVPLTDGLIVAQKTILTTVR
jgi:hypothetical protein